MNFRTILAGFGWLLEASWGHPAWGPFRHQRWHILFDFMKGCITQDQDDIGWLWITSWSVLEGIVLGYPVRGHSPHQNCHAFPHVMKGYTTQDHKHQDGFGWLWMTSSDWLKGVVLGYPVQVSSPKHSWHVFLHFMKGCTTPRSWASGWLWTASEGWNSGVFFRVSHSKSSFRRPFAHFQLLMSTYLG